jgi:beta-galactosidase GanA
VRLTLLSHRLSRRHSQARYTLLCIVSGIILLPSANAHAQSNPLPTLKRDGGVSQLQVDGRPYLIVGGELHNSSASSDAYMKPIWSRLDSLHLNTVIGTVSWELMEPEEGHFDFSLVDSQIAAARSHHMRLVLIWFGSWKNTSSQYVPLWVKQDKKRFFWAVKQTDPAQKATRGIYALSAFCSSCEQADAHAFRMLMRHLRETDHHHTVIMMQVENETGILGSGREYSPEANRAWAQPVPDALMNYLEQHRTSLRPEVNAQWSAHGFLIKGTWGEIFGTDKNAEEIFSAWHFASYISAIVRAGKEELALPMYVNAWLVQNSKQLPGEYPSGGPVSRMIDVWRAGAPNIDLFAPDIYISDVDGTYANYSSSNNALFFPESRPIAGNYLWAIGRYHAIGVAPFGVDDLQPDDPLGAVYAELSGAASLIATAQARGNIAAIEPETAGKTEFDLNGFHIQAIYASTRVSNTPAPAAGKKAEAAPDVVTSQEILKGGSTGYGLLWSAGSDEFYIMGRNLSLSFSATVGENNWMLYGVEEGTFASGRWVPGRRLNGDEASQLHQLSLPSQFVVRHVRLYRHVDRSSKEQK